MKIYAHRGYSEKFPEGSKIAYLEAVKAGADGFECDVRLTKDREIVCSTIDRFDVSPAKILSLANQLWRSSKST